MATLEKTPVKDLRKEASLLGIKNASSFKKQDLIEKISALQVKGAVITKERIQQSFTIQDQSTFGTHNPNFSQNFSDDIIKYMRGLREFTDEELNTPVQTSNKRVENTEKRPKEGSKSEKIIKLFNLGTSKYKIAKQLDTYYSVVDSTIKRYPHLINR